MKKLLSFCALTLFLACSKLPPIISQSAPQNPENRNKTLSLSADAKESLLLPGFPKTVAEMELRIKGIEDFVKGIENEIAETKDVTFKNTFQKLDLAYAAVVDGSEYFDTLEALEPEANLKEAAGEASARIGQLKSEMYLREDVYTKLKDYAGSEEATMLAGDDKILVDMTMVSFERNGMSKDEATRAQITAAQKEIAKFTQEFNAANAVAKKQTTSFSLAEIASLPEFVQKMAAPYKKDNDYQIKRGASTLLGPIATYADDEKLREKAWRISMGFTKEKALSSVTKIANARRKLAKLLGYTSWAAYRTAGSMSKTPERVEKMYSDITPKLRDLQSKERARLLAAKKAKTGNATELLPWDLSYYERLIRENEYGVDEEKIRAYFPMQKVIAGTFEVYGKLFGIEFTKYDKPFEKWQKDVALYIVKDAATKKLLGGVYLDLLARPESSKQAGAFCSVFVTPQQLPGTSLRTTAQVMANFRPIVAGANDTYLSYIEMRTFFHEFGHAVHGLVATVPYAKLGMESNKRDYVEGPSQIMEEFLEDYKIVSKLSSHKDTGEVLPEEMLKKVLDASNITKGEAMLRQISLGQIDMTINSRNVDDTDLADADVLKISDGAFQKFVDKYPDGMGYVAGFGHINSGDYHANYYGYIWSKVFALDCAEQYRKSPEGFLNPTLGRKWRDLVLSRNAADDPNILLHNFLGRDYNADAFNKSLE